MRIRVELLAKDDEDCSWCATPSAALLREIHERSVTESARWIAEVGGMKIALGDPSMSQTHGNPWRLELYVPRWFLNEQEGEITLDFTPSGSLPEAKHLNLKVLGELPEDWDIRACLEEPLSQLGVLQEGQVIPCPMLEGISLLIQVCEPAGPVFMHGNEVSLEVEHIDSVKPFVEPAPAGQPTTSQEDFASMLPMEYVAPAQSGFRSFQGTGHRLR